MSNSAMAKAIIRAEKECDKIESIYGSYSKYSELNEKSLDELISMNKMIVDLIKRKRSVESVSLKSKVKVGDCVFVNSKKADNKLFEVIKLNPKKAVLKDEFGTEYNCPYSLLILN